MSALVRELAKAMAVAAVIRLAERWADHVFDRATDKDEDKPKDKHLETAEPRVQVERLRVEVTRLRALNKRAVELLWLLDRPEARHPDVAEFLDGLGDL